MTLPVGAGRVRGLLLHKLIEEILSVETADDLASLAARGRVLLGELVQDARQAGALPDADDVAATVLRTLALPDIAPLRRIMVPELAIYAFAPDATSSYALAGRADAIEVVDGRARTVLNWESDAAP